MHNKNIPSCSSGTQFTIKGRVYNKRSMKEIGFLVLHDSIQRIQAIFKGDALNQLDLCKIGDMVIIDGILVYNSKQNQKELVEPKIKKVYTSATPQFDYSKQISLPDIDFRLQHRCLSIRTPKSLEIFRLTSKLIMWTKQFFDTHTNACDIVLPAIVPASGEGGASTFHMQYFDQAAFLTQSGQLYKQMAVATFGSISSLSYCFRAEHSHTKHHLTESRQIEFETLLFDQDINIVLDTLELLVKHLVSSAQQYIRETKLNHIESAVCSINTQAIIPRVTFDEAIDLYNKTTNSQVDDITRDVESTICDIMKQNTGSDFVFITHFPKIHRPFYSKPDPNNPDYTLTFDLLFRGLEVSSGGQRIHKHEELIDAIHTNNLDEQAFASYLDAFLYGMPPHGGFGLGLERFMLKLVNEDNVRDVTLFPSDCFRINGVKISS